MYLDILAHSPLYASVINFEFPLITSNIAHGLLICLLFIASVLYFKYIMTARASAAGSIQAFSIPVKSNKKNRTAAAESSSTTGRKNWQNDSAAVAEATPSE